MNVSSRKALSALSLVGVLGTATACTIMGSVGQIGGESSTDDEVALMSGCGDDDGSAPRELRCTGLYAASGGAADPSRIAKGVRAFEPGALLWSDGAEKHRFMLLPDGKAIDTSDPDEWVFPVGTKTWKEFVVNGRRIETRYFEKVRDDKWLRATYVWSADQTSAKREDNGVTIDVDGTPYEVPSTTQCDTCHKGRKDKLLGVDAIMSAMPSAKGITLDSLNEEGRLDPPLAPSAVRLPSDVSPEAAKALAWMHVNCGVSCHNKSPDAEGIGSSLFLRIDVREIAASAAGGGANTLAPLATTVDVETRTPKWAGETRVVPGNPEASLLLRLVETRERGQQMPPIGSKVVDREGARVVREWITSMKRGDEASTPRHESQDARAASH